MFSGVQLFVTPWTLGLQAPLSIGYSRQEYWSGVPCPPPRDLPDPGIEPRSPALQADSLLPSYKGSPSIVYATLKLNFSLIKYLNVNFKSTNYSSKNKKQTQVGA